MDKEEYYKLCYNHDWNYYFSDDYGVYSRGQSAQNKLISLAKSDPVLGKIFEAWDKWHGDIIKGIPSKRPILEEINVN